MKKGKATITNYQKIHAVNFGLAGGIVIGLSVLITTLLTAVWGLFPSYTGILIDIYGLVGFRATPFGAVLGAIYAFIDSFIIFWVFALLYNKLLK